MRGNVIGYDKTLEYLKRGYSIVNPPLDSKDFLYDKENHEYITIRKGVIIKLLKQNLITRGDNLGWSTTYHLKEVA